MSELLDPTESMWPEKYARAIAAFPTSEYARILVRIEIKDCEGRAETCTNHAADPALSDEKRALWKGHEDAEHLRADTWRWVLAQIEAMPEGGAS